MRVLVTGGSGGLGRYVVRAFHLAGATEVWHPGREFDLTAAGSACAMVSSWVAGGGSIVVHLAAATDTTWCECFPEGAVAINAQGTMRIAEACSSSRIRLVYVSTDAVFSRTGPHGEMTTPAPSSIYGWSKFAGEQAVAALGTNGLIVRANFFTRHCRSKTSFAEYVVREASAGRNFNCYENVRSTPVFAKTLAERIVRAVFEREYGILHVASCDSVNRAEQARMICEAYGLPMSGIVVDSTKMSDGRLATAHGLCGTVREEIAKMVKEEPL